MVTLREAAGSADLGTSSNELYRDIRFCRGKDLNAYDRIFTNPGK